ncbi:MAG: hypothetical protein ACYTDY_19070 [Planctomycetota bacterium]|jgi:hypothetical protein
MKDRATLTERSALPPILLPEDVAVVLGLPSERSAREFLQKNGVPHTRIGGRVYVLTKTLVAFFEGKQERRPTRDEIRKKATETVRQIAPTARARGRGRKPPRVDRRST